MDRNAYRDDDDGDGGGTDQPDAYWRRRVITLALGLGLLGMLAWAFSGGGGKPVPSGTSAVPPATALDTAIPGLAAGAPSASAAVSAASSPGSTAQAAASGTSSATPGGPAISPSASRPSAAGASKTSGRCASGALVLSLFTDRSSYGPSQYPRFEVYAVSTSAGSCAFDPGQLQVVVLTGGRIIWDSADCGHGGGRVAQLPRGVPAQDTVVWNREITLPGCQVLAPSARPGTYTVQARTATVQSPSRGFKLTS